MAQTYYSVGIDFGTTWSAAAVLRSGETRPDVVRLGGLTSAVASMIFMAADGSILCGDAAARRAVTDPRRVVREFKRRIGDDTPLIIGGLPVPAERVAAQFVCWILDRVAEREGGQPDRVALTHPADWGPHKREILATTLAERGVADPLLLSEPEAAAIGYASTQRVEVGQALAVYDLGGGTFDAAVVRKLDGGRFEVVGKPFGIERLGGVDFDDAIFDHVREAVGPAWDELDPDDPAVLSAVAGLRRECTAAKEALSADTEVQIPVMLPGQHRQVRLGRSEFEERIRPAVAETVEALQRALEAAGTSASDLGAVLMVGGSSRIPLVAQLVSAELGRPLSVDADPKTVIATGAAVAAGGQLDARAAVADPGAALASPAPTDRSAAPAAAAGAVLIAAAAAVDTASAPIGAATPTRPRVSAATPAVRSGDPLPADPLPVTTLPADPLPVTTPPADPPPAAFARSTDPAPSGRSATEPQPAEPTRPEPPPGPEPAGRWPVLEIDRARARRQKRLAAAAAVMVAASLGLGGVALASGLGAPVPAADTDVTEEGESPVTTVSDATEPATVESTTAGAAETPVPAPAPAPAPAPPAAQPPAARPVAPLTPAAGAGRRAGEAEQKARPVPAPQKPATTDTDRTKDTADRDTEKPDDKDKTTTADTGKSDTSETDTSETETSTTSTDTETSESTDPPDDNSSTEAPSSTGSDDTTTKDEP